MYKSDSSSSLIKPHASASVKMSKLKIYNFMESLFKISMSEDVLVDMVIDDDPSGNKVIIVGRPKLLGSFDKTNVPCDTLCIYRACDKVRDYF